GEGRRDGRAVDRQSGQTKTVKGKDAEKGHADGEKSDRGPDPEIPAKGKLHRQTVLCEGTALEASHDERCNRRDKEEQPIIEKLLERSHHSRSSAWMAMTKPVPDNENTCGHAKQERQEDQDAPTGPQTVGPAKDCMRRLRRGNRRRRRGNRGQPGGT